MYVCNICGNMSVYMREGMGRFCFMDIEFQFCKNAGETLLPGCGCTHPAWVPSKRAKMAWVKQMLEHLPRVLWALCSTPSTELKAKMMEFVVVVLVFSCYQFLSDAKKIKNGCLFSF